LRARVPRMFRVGRRAILADRRARGIVGVESVVAVGTQAAELAKPECGEITPMRRDVIGDGRWCDAPGLQAESAQWLDPELMRAAAYPASSTIPAMNFPTVWHPVFLYFPSRESTVCRNQVVGSFDYGEIAPDSSSIFDVGASTSARLITRLCPP